MGGLWVAAISHSSTYLPAKDCPKTVPLTTHILREYWNFRPVPFKIELQTIKVLNCNLEPSPQQHCSHPHLFLFGVQTKDYGELAPLGTLPFAVYTGKTTSESTGGFLYLCWLNQSCFVLSQGLLSWVADSSTTPFFDARS